MSEIIPFDYEGQPIRTYEVDEVVWFSAPDVCRVLDHTNVTVALQSLDEDERRSLTRSEALSIGYPFTDQRIQSVSLVSEAGLYSLILRSRKPEARAFKRWITHEVLPQLRKAGGYMVERMSPRQLAELVIKEADRADQAEAKVAELEPKAAIADMLTSRADKEEPTWDIAEAAKLLTGDPAISIGRQRLFAKLNEWHLIYRSEGRWTPYQREVENTKRLDIKPYLPHYSETQGGMAEWHPQPRLTWKGLMYVHRQLRGTVPLQQLVDRHGEQQTLWDEGETGA